MNKIKDINDVIVSKKMLIPFVLITSLFALWGFANDITNPLVAAFGRVMEIPNGKAALVQMAFYGGYFTMAIPAALFVMKYSYKVGILIGLSLYATGALLFYPAASNGAFGFFLMALYILTFGLAFLETTANPYIMSMGSAKTATRRLNLAQSFNPIGSISGMFVAQHFILSALWSDNKNESGELIYSSLQGSEKATWKAHDLMVIRDPYVILGLVVIVMFLVILFYKMPNSQKADKRINFSESLKLLLKNPKYKGGVIAQIFYVAAQIMCWTFIIHYAENIGIPFEQAQVYNMVAMGMFISGRFISTFIMKYVSPGKLLMLFAIGAFLTILGAIFIVGHTGLICLVLTSIFMSLMFPTIYGIALQGMGEEAKLGAAGLVMAIVGGALMPFMQGKILDIGGKGLNDVLILGVPEVNFSFILPLICFVVISIYGYSTKNNYQSISE